MINQIHTVYQKKREPCGIDLFNRKLRICLTKFDIATKSYSIEQITSDDSEIYLFHYTPALYANCNEIFTNFFTKSKASIIVCIHSAYPKGNFQQLGDTFSPYLEHQLQIIKDYSSIIISLSDSTTKNLLSWDFNTINNNIYTLYHPGLYNNTKNLCDFEIEPYVFLGGITRPKKNFLSLEYLRLFETLKNSGVNVWLHSTPDIRFSPALLPVWRFTTNELNWRSWSDAISNAMWVLCPYNTKIQTVSGIISESISVGTMVLSTSFPYALEISKKYKDYVIINDDLEKWTKIILTCHKKLNTPNYPDWDSFANDFINILGKNRRYQKCC